MGPPPLNSPLPREPPLPPSHKTSWSGLSPGHSCIKGSFPMSPRPTPTPIGKMCVFQVSKYCHLPESSMASPFSGGGGGRWRGGGRGCVLRLPALQKGVHVASHSNRIHRMGQGNSPGTAGVSKSNIPLWLICIFPDRPQLLFPLSLLGFYNNRTS